MNILFLSSKSLYPLKDGHSMRSYNILKRIARERSVYFLTYFQSKEEKKYFSEMKKMCASAKGFTSKLQGLGMRYIIALIKNVFSALPFVAQKYYSKGMAREIQRILRNKKIDIIHVDILPMMVFSKLFTGYPVVLVEHNVESLLLQRRVKYIKNIIFRLFWYFQYLKLAKFEKAQVSKVNCCAVVSSQEEAIIRSMAPHVPVVVVPNGVDLQYFSPSNGKPDEKNLLFLGSLTWFANFDGMKFFCEEMLPEISRLSKDISITVLGKENPKFPYSKVLKQTGFVDDVRPYVHEAAVFIVPLRIGGGTRLKILDAMAMGKAIVSTSIGCEGLEVEHEKHLIIEDKPLAFAKRVAELLNDKEKRITLGKNARRLVEEKYDWDIIGKEMNRIYDKVAR